MKDNRNTERLPLRVPPAGARVPVSPGTPVKRLAQEPLTPMYAFIIAAGILPLTAVVIGFTWAMFALTGLGFAAAAVGLKYPAYGVLGLAVLCTMDVMSRLFAFSIGLLPWNTFNYWLLLVIVLNLGLFLRLNNAPSRLLQVFILVLAAWLLFTPEKGFEAGQMTVINVASCFGIIVTLWKAGNDSKVWYFQALTTGTVGAALGLVFYAQQGSLPPINYNAWAYVPLTGMIGICFGHRFAPQRGWGSHVLTALLTINFMWVFISTSRGTLLVATVCLVYYLWTMKSAGQRFVMAGLFLVLGLVVISRYGDLEEQMIHRIVGLFNPEKDISDRTSGRSELALGAWYIFQENPLGVGTGAFSQEWKALGYERGGSQWGQRRAAHSGWMATLAENGLAGFVVLAAFVLSFTGSGMARSREGLLPVGVFVTVALSLALLTTEFSSKGIWYLVSAGIVLLHRWRPPGGNSTTVPTGSLPQPGRVKP